MFDRNSKTIIYAFNNLVCSKLEQHIYQVTNEDQKAYINSDTKKYCSPNPIASEPFIILSLLHEAVNILKHQYSSVCVQKLGKRLVTYNCIVIVHDIRQVKCG